LFSGPHFLAPEQARHGQHNLGPHPRGLQLDLQLLNLALQLLDPEGRRDLRAPRPPRRLRRQAVECRGQHFPAQRVEPCRAHLELLARFGHAALAGQPAVGPRRSAKSHVYAMEVEVKRRYR